MADGNYIDDQFGPLEWKEDAQEWFCLIPMPAHEEHVGLSLPPEYVESQEIQTHIRAILRIIVSNEADYRRLAADEIFADDGYHLFWPEGQPFDRDEFAREMHLGGIVFDTQFRNPHITLWYECGDIVEHVLVIFLSWNGQYEYARDM